MLKKDELIYWCVVYQDQVWSDGKTVPFMTEDDLPLSIINPIKIGEYQNHEVYWATASQSLNDKGCSLRSLLMIDPVLFGLMSRGVQFSHAQLSHQFCGTCGEVCHLTVDNTLPIMQCTQCKKVHYSPISPCVIMAVRRNNEILLAQHCRHNKPLSTVLAGFVEAGETLEQAVAREVFEETNITVKNIRYFSSQPWAFPSQLMVGFLADYDFGEILVDPSELQSADWVKETESHDLAPKGTLARALIDHTFFEIHQSVKTIDK
jgi:NAD+ diphosphatase